LLLLHPGNKSDPIKCNLVVEDTKSESSYEAISYVWGDPNNRTSITCDGKSMSITVSLWTALQRFRLPDEPRRLWADAVCIDQQNLEERGQQVAMMGTIYQRAENVLIWLGPDEEGEAEECLNLIDATANEVSNAIKLYGSWAAIPQLSVDGVHGWENLPWASLDRMLQLPWFSRLWVIQEVLLATSALVHYGDVEFPWWYLQWTVVFVLQKLPKLLTHFRLSTSPVLGICIIDSMSTREDGLQNSRDRITKLLNVLYIGQYFEASDSRDHFYALMGLANARLEVDTLVPTDYSLSIQQIFEMVATRAMAMMQNLYFLSLVHHTENTLQDNFPSWVPQWHQRAQSAPLKTTMYPEEVFYDADAGSSFCCDGVTAAGVLHLRGLMFDVISSCSNTFYEGAFDTLVTRTDQNIACDLVPQILSAKLELIYPPTDRSKVISLTLIGGSRYCMESDNMKDVEKDDLHHHLADFAAYLSRVGVVGHEDRTTAEQKLQLQEDTKDGDWYRFKSNVGGSCQGRKLFVTQKGYLGLGPAVLEEDDLCCVLYGAKMPFILRRSGDHYLFLGQSYIHGIMRGEAMEMLRNGELQEEAFNIH